MATAWLSRLRGYRADLLVLFLMVAGFALNVSTPIWFAPPYFEYTSGLYLILFFAWVPVFIVLMRRKRQVRRIALVVIGGTLLMSCTCMLLRSRSMFTLPSLDQVRCEPRPTDSTHVRYACTRHAFEGPQYDETLIIDGPARSPILLLIEASRP